MGNLKGMELVYKPNDSQIDKRIVNNVESLRELVKDIGIKNLSYCDISHYTDDNGNEQYIRQSLFMWAKLHNTNELFLAELFTMWEFWQQVRLEFIDSNKDYLCSSILFKNVWECGIIKVNKELQNLASEFLESAEWKNTYKANYEYMLFHKRSDKFNTAAQVRLDFLAYMIEKTKK